MKKSLSIILFLIFTFPLCAWNARGHMVVAAIAYKQLDTNQKEEITELLKHHPDYKYKWSRDYKKLNNKIELGQYLMMRASVWPDEIRSKRNYNHKFHRSEWHYVTYKIDFANGHDTTPIDGNVEPNIVWASEHTGRMIENSALDNATRAMYLAWFIHLIGDIHQPLHCGSLFNATYPKGDRGGQCIFCKAK